MVNYYTEFSVMIPIKTDEDKEWFQGMIEEYLESLEYIAFDHAVEDDGVWCYSGESGEPEQVALLAQMFISERQPDLIWCMEYAHTCSRPRVDAFGGGGIVVTKDEIYFMDSGFLTRQKVKEIEEARDENESQ